MRAIGLLLAATLLCCSVHAAVQHQINTELHLTKPRSLDAAHRPEATKRSAASSRGRFPPRSAIRGC